MKEYSLYVIKNTVNNKHYVGQTYKYPLDRVYEHIMNSTRQRHTSLLSRAIRRYGSESFILLRTLHCNFNLANSVEKHLIKQYNSLIPNGYNILEFGQVSDIPEGWWKGRTRPPETMEKIAKILREKYKGKGNPFYGKTHSTEVKETMVKVNKERWGKLSEIERKEEIKKLHEHRQQFINNETTEQKQKRYSKISQANKGFIHTKESLEKNRLAHLGKIHTEETRQKMSKAKLGKMKSEETKQNMRKAQRARVSEESKIRTIRIKEMLEQGIRGVEIAKSVGCTPEYIYKVKKGERGTCFQSQEKR